MKNEDTFSLFPGLDKLRAEDMTHCPMNDEIRFYHDVATGNVEAIQRHCREVRFEEMEGIGILSRDPITNMKYHYVITVALVARFCKEYGMELEHAFRLSDYYIQRLDDAHTPEKIKQLHDQMALEYTGRMRLLQKKSNLSKPVSDCLEYIYQHIRERLTVDILAEEIQVSASYLSRAFRKELGVTVSNYIRDQKMERAEYFLRYTDFSLIDIAAELSFSSQSHFIQLFRTRNGMTPKKYRDLYHMKPLKEMERNYLEDETEQE